MSSDFASRLSWIPAGNRCAAAFCQLFDFLHILAKYKQGIFISDSLHMV